MGSHSPMFGRTLQRCRIRNLNAKSDHFYRRFAEVEKFNIKDQNCFAQFSFVYSFFWGNSNVNLTLGVSHKRNPEAVILSALLATERSV